MHQTSTSYVSYANFTRKVSTIQQESVVWCGDMNITPDPHMDSLSLPKICKPTMGALAFCQPFQIYDVLRCWHTEECDYTYFSHCHNSYSHINLFLLDQGTVQKILASTVLPIIWSDHSPVCITIEDHTRPSPTCIPGSCNLTLLNHFENLFLMNKDSVSDLNIVCVSHKTYMRGIYTQVGAWDRRQRKQHINNLLADIQGIDSLNSYHIPILNLNCLNYA